MSARREGDKIVVLMPSGLSAEAEQRLVSELVGKLQRSSSRQGQREESQLAARATRLSGQYLAGRARPASVRWVPAMRSRWASCTPDTGTIRVSELLREVPDYVLDYILVHELAHLIVPGGHTREFWAEVNRYPRTERALGYLEAFAGAAERSRSGGADPATICDPLDGCEDAWPQVEAG